MRARPRADLPAKARAVLDELGLAAKAEHPAGSLTLAERKRLELARALATEPALLLLDEVMSGLTDHETERLVEEVRAINARGVAILLIEHVMRAVMSLAQRVVVLNYGERIAEGRPADVANDPLVIEAYGIEAGYGDLTAIRGVSLEVHAGEIVALIGSNGAGKTTTLRAVSGLIPLRQGAIELDGRRLAGLTPAAIVAGGVAHVPEGRQLFPTMTVLENLARLAERRRQLAGTLSGGEQQMTAIGRALMARPRLLMLDEPSLGLAPVVLAAIFQNLAAINRDGVTILLVEQNVLRALRLSHRAYVIENGAIAFAGPSAALLADERIKRAYLGR
ncbi:MAG: branched-chain amino acid transporter ATP-binding protein [Candidatus Rokubacteria bacterium]|nr:branched-chain amino acid transporter ATP-binding protein [Candidatus Rokubacteria bacterium]